MNETTFLFEEKSLKKSLNDLTDSCENTKPSGFATGIMYQSMVLAISLTAELVEYNSSLMTHVAVADAAHSRA